MPFIIDIDPVAFRALGLEVRWYGIIVALAAAVALWIATRAARERELPVDALAATLPWLGIAALVGARALYVIQHELDRVATDPARFVMVWMGGLSFYGAVAGMALALIVFARRERIPVLHLLDIAAPAAAIGQAVGHLGCLIGGDSYGIPANVPWAVIYTNPDAMAPLNIPLHPTQAYEAVGLAALFAGLWLGRRWLQGIGPGAVVATYLAGLAAIRFALFYLRDEPAVLWGLKTAQLLGIGIAVVALVLFAIARRDARAPTSLAVELGQP